VKKEEFTLSRGRAQEGEKKRRLSTEIGEMGDCKNHEKERGARKNQ